MTFVDIRGLFSSVDASEGNWGIAHRRMTSNDSIFGVYGFYDLKNSSLDNKFSQITLGTELLGRDWGVRANGYIPINTSAAVSALNSALLQDGNIFVVDGQERAYYGIDLEYERLLWFANDGCDDSESAVPIDMELWGSVGAYHFDTNAVGFSNLTGPRARAELRLLDLPRLGTGSRLVLGGQVQYDDVRGTVGTGMVSIRVPFGPTGGQRLTGLNRRMVAPIVRDIDVVTTLGTGAPQAAVVVGNNANITGATIVRAGDDAEAITEGAGDNSVVIYDGADGQINVTNTIDINDGQSIVGGGGGLQVQGANSGAIATFTAPGTRPTVANETTGNALFSTGPNAFGSTFSGMDFVTRQDGSVPFDIGDTNSNQTFNDLNIQTRGETAPAFDIEGNKTNFNISNVTIETLGSMSPGIDIAGNNTNFNLSNVTIKTRGPGGIGIAVNGDNVGFNFTDVDVTTYDGSSGTGEFSPSFDIESNNSNFNFTRVNAISFGIYSPGFDIEDENNGFSFSEVLVSTGNKDSAGFEINDNNNNFDFNNVTVQIDDKRSDNGDGAAFDIENGNTNFSFSAIAIETNDTRTHGFRVADNNSGFIFLDVLIQTNDFTSHGFYIADDNADFSFTNVDIDTDGGGGRLSYRRQQHCLYVQQYHGGHERQLLRGLPNWRREHDVVVHGHCREHG